MPENTIETAGATAPLPADTAGKAEGRAMMIDTPEFAEFCRAAPSVIEYLELLAAEWRDTFSDDPFRMERSGPEWLRHTAQKMFALGEIQAVSHRLMTMMPFCTAVY